jgi:DNA topoisomerase-2
MDAASPPAAEPEIEHLEEAEHLLHRPDMYCGSTTPTTRVSHVFTLRETPAPEALDPPLNSPPAAVAVDVAGADADTTDTDAGFAGEGTEKGSVVSEATTKPKPKKSAWTGISASYSVSWRPLEHADALINLVMEIVTNALDRQFRDPTMTKIEVWFDCKKAGGPGWLRVRNDGQGVPVIFDEGTQMWKPHMAFGMFRTGSNFNDVSGPRWTGGRNGYGCKLTNVFSSRFKVDTADPTTKKRFRQTFESNMSVASEPTVTAHKAKKGYTDVSFLLELERFGLSEGLTGDARAAITTAVIDSSACSLKKTTMWFNDIRLGVRSLKDYALMFSSAGPQNAAYDFLKGDGDMVVWEVCVVPSIASRAEESCYGFVNSLHCAEGTHMSLAMDRVSEALSEYLRKTHKRKELRVTAHSLREHMFMVVRIMVDAPKFGGQTKDKLTTPRSQFGFDWRPTPAFVRTLVGSGIADALYHHTVAKEERKAGAQTSSRGARGSVVVEKYEGASNARKRGSNCKLLVTEGDSAKQLALAGLSSLPGGREDFGVFPILGKLLNVRVAGLSKLMANKEVTNMMKILGLEYGKKYSTLDNLRYKKLVIFTDQDPDGSHIAGLLLNFLHHLFPSVLALDPDFVQRFATPIVRVTPKGAGAAANARVARRFFATQSFDRWVREEDVDLKNYHVKYFKGLGTSTNAMAREYFAAYHEHVISMRWSERSDDMMNRFFAATEKGGQSGPAARRCLLTHHYDPGDYVDYAEARCSYEDFLTKEMLPFAAYSNKRALASAIDGFKPSQRKVMFTFFKKNLTQEQKVAQVAPLVATETKYHHGEASILETVVGMAQDHVGTNNLNLLRPEGQFGSRHDPPSVHSAARYIFTGLDPVARALFPQADDPVLDYLSEEQVSIEPATFAPVIPMVLVNGCLGIGYGWSTSIPTHDPRRVASKVREWIDGGDAAVRAGAPLVPWVAGFDGDIALSDAGDAETNQIFYTRGTFSVIGEDVVEITELPVGKWTNVYVTKVLEERLMIQSPPQAPAIAPFIWFVEKLWTNDKIRIVLHCDAAALAPHLPNLCGVLKLTGVIRSTNMHLHDACGELKNYASAEDIVCEHAAFRLHVYVKRKAHQIGRIEAELMVLVNRSRFVQGLIEETLVLHRMQDDEIDALLEGNEFDRVEGSFDYLLGMTYRATTAQKVEKMERATEALRQTLAQLRACTARDLWRADLDALDVALNDFDARKRERYGSDVPMTGVGAIAQKNKNTRKRKTGSSTAKSSGVSISKRSK